MMTNAEYKQCADDYVEQIDAELHNIISGLGYSDAFKEILDYALFPGGKRLRPMLTLAWHNVYAPADRYALKYACGVEIMHSYSLIHDDMPCMDDDEMRRGKPTVHKRFGEGKALLAGDALLDLANCILNTPTPEGKVSPYAFLHGMCGDAGLINGQLVDMYGDIDNIFDLVRMYKHKTGSLISLACMSGYLLGNNIGYERAVGHGNPHSDAFELAAVGDDLERDFYAVREFGDELGVAFQLYDDLTEYIGGEKADGTSILNFLDFDAAKRMLNSGLDLAARALDTVSGDTTFLRRLLNKFVIA